MSLFHLLSDSTSPMLVAAQTYKPFHYPWAVELAIEHDKIHWGEWEVDLQEDVAQWKGGKLTRPEMNLITQILRLFTQSDVAVGGNYYDLFLGVLKNNEIRMMQGSFANREAVHMRAYAILNDTLGFPDEEYSAFLRYQVMADKLDFMVSGENYTQEGLALALAKSAFNEGVSLFAAFVMLLNFQRFSKMKGMCKVVEWSIRDESMHVEGNTRLFREFCEENPHIVTDEFKLAIYDMARRVVELEDTFVDLAFEMGAVEGLTPDEVKQYVRFITDRRLVQLGLKANWGVEKNPLPWVDWIVSGDSLANFFEQRVSDYNAQGMSDDGQGWGWSPVALVKNPRSDEWFQIAPLTRPADEWLVLTMPNCAGCETVKDMLKQRSLNFQTVSGTTPEGIGLMMEHKFRSAPQVFRNGQLIGGVEAVRQALAV